ncbi:MAG: ABC transporter permease [Acidimicrobiales bacterium]|nr:ABC transporter permease [Acidimicrobiales bacterium]
MSFGWLVRHNVWSKKVRSGLTALAVAIGVMTVVALGIVTDSLKTTAAGVLQVGAADFTVAQKGVNDILSSALTEQQLAKVRGIDGVRSATGVLLDTERLDKAHPLVVEVGIKPVDLKPFGVQIADGRAFRADAENEVMLGIHLAQDLGIKVGGTIHVTDKTMRVVGVFNTGNTFGDSTVMFPLAPFQAYQRQPGGLSLLFVKVDPGTKVSQVRSAVERSSPLLVTISSLIDFGRADRSYQLITAADRAATFLAIAVGAIFVMNAMVLSLVERYREFGILRAVGWSRRRLIALVFGEAMVIAFIGAALGVGLGFVAISILENLPSLEGVLKPTFESWVFGRALLTAILVTAIGALYPALRAAHLSPQEAMRRE